ncbi:DUF4041 domain-containing protein [Micromonospora sp. NPDC005652]|uniref:DUF4041 domain-containing protein n=1 Tax=Micromonospora sp. NPDC005652 TaxID=3157046 RepID=UPI0033E9581C
MTIRYNPPPNWPPPPPGWAPPPGWSPDPAWGPPPPGWQLWITDQEIPLFGARGKARELAAENAQLREQRAEQQRLMDRLQAEMRRLGVLGVIELERRRGKLEQEVAELQRRTAQQTTELERRVAALRQQVVVTEETALLQEAGVYRYHHPLTDAIAYQGALATVQDQIKAMVLKDGGAIRASTNWVVSGSAAKGRAMVRDYSKLILRAYNAEADNLVRGLKPYKLDSAVERLNKVAETIARLGKTMDIRVSDGYHKLRIKELRLTADYLAKVAEEKEREREEKARLREERKVQQEIDRERARLEKERQHYANALAALRAKGDEQGVAEMQARLTEVEAAAEAVDFRAANVRAGYVYVISNIGAFGENMVKIGMTRRLDPLDRVRELSDASVPFNFDVHALFFSEDAVGIEAQMHSRLADRRVNLINQRREFFRVTPAEAKKHLLALAGNLLQYEEVPEALEYRQSVANHQPA